MSEPKSQFSSLLDQLITAGTENGKLRDRIEQLEREIETLKEENGELALGDDW